MTRKLHNRGAVSVVLLTLMVVGGSGCANRRRSVNADSGLSGVSPNNPPAAGVMADSARLSGLNSTGASAGNVSPSGVGRTGVEDFESPSYSRDSYGSRSSSSSGCSTGGCGRCGG